MKECECKHWASEDVIYVNMFGHHPECGFRPMPSVQFRIMLDVVRTLVQGMEAWAQDEDGIHPDAWAAYKKAKMILGEEVAADAAGVDNDRPN